MVALYEDILFDQFALVDAEKSSTKPPHSKALWQSSNLSLLISEFSEKSA